MERDRGKLGNFLNEIISWNWAEFCINQRDHKYTGFQAAVFSLVRTCADGKLGAIKLAIARVDGNIETPVRVEYPRVWYVYPDAESVALPSPDEPTPELPSSTSLIVAPQLTVDEVGEDVETEATETAATLSLRQTLHKMADEPRILTQVILKRKRQVEESPELFVTQESEDAAVKVPLVKSVIAANLLNLAEKNNFEAIMELFDQIDGKLVEVIRILGDDIYLTQYALEAPAGAVKNKDGIYMIEAKEAAEKWKQKLKKD